jgi:hypothetical protein
MAERTGAFASNVTVTVVSVAVKHHQSHFLIGLIL